MIGLENMLYLKNEFMNGDDFLYADSGVIIFGVNDNPTLPLSLFIAGSPMQFYLLIYF